MSTSIKDTTRKLLDQQTRSGKHKRRKLSDLLARYGIALGGLSVIAAVVLICFYLLWVVLPIFKPASIELEKDFSWSQEELLHIEVEEYGEIAFGLTYAGGMRFVDIENNSDVATFDLPQKQNVTAFAQLDLKGMMAVAYENGDIQLLQQDYSISYPDNKRKITPTIIYPFGEDAISFSEHQVSLLNGKLWEDGLLLAGVINKNQVVTKLFEVEESFLGEGLEIEESYNLTIQLEFEPKFLLVTQGPDWLYAIGKKGELSSYHFDDGEWVLHESKALTDAGINVTQADFLLGQVSLMIGDTTGVISQWFQV